MAYIAGSFAAVGDSITVGTGATTGYAQRIANDLGITLNINGLGGFGWAHDGVGATGGDSLTTVAPANVDLHKSDFLTLFAGTNDMYYGFTGAQTYTAFETYIQARLSAGWKRNHIIVLTCLMRTNITNVNRQAYNAGLIAGRETYGYLLCRLDLDSRIGGATSNLDTNYFGDGIHPNDAGAQIIADLMEAVTCRVAPIGFRA